MKRYFVATQETTLVGGSHLAWSPIGSALDGISGDQIQDAVRKRYSPGDTLPTLYLIEISQLGVSQAIHVDVDFVTPANDERRNDEPPKQAEGEDE